MRKRESGNVGRPRDLAITDFRFVMRTDGVLTDRRGRSYLVYAPIARTAKPGAPVLEEVVPPATRRLVEWAVYTLCGGAAMIAIWFMFLVPVASSPPSQSPFQAISLNVQSELRSMSSNNAK